jgi:hypothetical protein
LAPALSLFWIAPTEPNPTLTLVPVSCSNAWTTVSNGCSIAAAASTAISAAVARVWLESPKSNIAVAMVNPIWRMAPPVLLRAV